MTSLLAAPLVALLACMAGAQQQKAPITPLEGVWREPVQTGEKGADKLTVTIRGDVIALTWCGNEFQGTIGAATARELTVVEFVITPASIDGKKTESMHTGRCIIQENRLYLQVFPRSPDPKLYDGGKGRELAPITFQLEKLKK